MSKKRPELGFPKDWLSIFLTLPPESRITGKPHGRTFRQDGRLDHGPRGLCDQQHPIPALLRHARDRQHRMTVDRWAARLLNVREHRPRPPPGAGVVGSPAPPGSVCRLVSPAASSRRCRCPAPLVLPEETAADARRARSSRLPLPVEPGRMARSPPARAAGAAARPGSPPSGHPPPAAGVPSPCPHAPDAAPAGTKAFRLGSPLRQSSAPARASHSNCSRDRERAPGGTHPLG